MVAYVLAALRACDEVDRIVVVGPLELAGVVTTPGVEIAPCGDSMIDNIRIGVTSLEARGKVLLVTSDIPLIDGVAIRDFLERCHGNGQADLYYPIVSKEVNERDYPGVRRTYVRLQEGVFTGGNLILLESAIVDSCPELLGRAIALRKQPLQLARLLGGRCFARLVCSKLSIDEIEARVERMLGFRGRAVVSEYAEVGIDVDKPSDLELAQRILAERAN